MEQINILEQLKNIFAGKTEFSILEHNIDIDTQMEFFEIAFNMRDKLKSEEIINIKEEIFGDKLNLQEKKHLLVGLSSLDKVEVYRTLEKYAKEPDEELKNWAALAVHESRMRIESSLLQQHRVIISTGLGGKNNKFRYFSCFVSNTEKFTPLQRGIIKKEFYFYIDKFEGEIEEIKFRNNACYITFCVPLYKRALDYVEIVVNECNILGNFIYDDFMLSNVKKLSFNEIIKIYELKKKQDESN